PYTVPYPNREIFFFSHGLQNTVPGTLHTSENAHTVMQSKQSALLGPILKIWIPQNGSDPQH
ncbi:MAG: hypothetical protein ACK559_41760, partial [bacterium]